VLNDDQRKIECKSRNFPYGQIAQTCGTKKKTITGVIEDWLDAVDLTTQPKL